MNKFRFFAIFLSFLMAAGSGCSRRAPDPPMTRGELILEIFYAIDRKDYKTALARTKRLHTLDPSNSNLAELEQVLECNIPIRNASILFTSGKHQEAVRMIEDAIRRSGNVKQLEDARDDMSRIGRLNELTENIYHPVSMAQLEVSLAEYRKVTAGHPELADLLAFAEQQYKKNVQTVRARENKLVFLCAGWDLDMLSALNPAFSPGYMVQKEEISNFINRNAVKHNKNNSTKRER